MSAFYRGLFKEIQLIDQDLGAAVNKKMCTDLCKCQNDLNETIKKIYFADGVADSLNGYGRTTNPLDNQDGFGMVAFKFQIDVNDQAYETMLDCYSGLREKKLNEAGNEVQI
jgi:hypothetical protein